MCVHLQRDAWQQLSSPSSAAWEQGRLFTPRQRQRSFGEAGGEFCFQPSLGVRVRKYQRVDEENRTKVCYLQCCFDEGGVFKIIALKDNREGDFLTQN